MSEQYKEAFVAYERALAAMPPELRVDVAGLVVISAAESALAQYEVDGDSDLLVRARAMVRGYLEEAAETTTVAPELLEHVHLVLVRIEAQLPPPATRTQPEQQIERPLAEEQAAPEQASNDDVSLRQVSSPNEATLSSKYLAAARPQDDRRARKASSKNRPAHLLIISGGLLEGVGVGLAIAGSRQIPWFEREMRQLGWVTAHPSYDSELAKAKRVRNINIALGSGLSVVGSALIITGILLLRRCAKRTGSMAALDRWQPRPSRRLTSAFGSAPVTLQP